MNAIHSLFDSVGQCLTLDTASRLDKFAVSEEVQQQLDDWADSNLLGELTEGDKQQYEATMRALNFIAVLQSRARQVIATHRNP